MIVDFSCLNQGRIDAVNLINLLFLYKNLGSPIIARRIQTYTEIKGMVSGAVGRENTDLSFS